MKRKLSFVLFVAIALFQLSLLFQVQPAMADESLLNNQLGFSQNGDIQSAFGPEAPTDIRSSVARIINTVLSLIGVIFVVILVVAGFRYMTAAGNEEQTRTAIKQITQAAIGLLIILTSWGITYFIMSNLSRAAGNGAILP